MIVKNEAHIIHEALDSVAPYIDYWVIVDTGSTDETREVIHAKMGHLNIPGELYERPWRSFGENRSEALQLAQGHCDYILVLDADDILQGAPDFAGLTADGYLMLIEEHRIGLEYWRLQLFRDGVAWRYTGITHEFALCDTPHTEQRLPGSSRIVYRQLGSNSLIAGKLERDRDLLIAELERHPEDTRSAFYLARTYEGLSDYGLARDWYAHRAAMGGWDEEVYCAMYKLADMMDRLNEPWAEVQDAYLQAWAYRPGRVEGLLAIAIHYRRAGEYELGYLFASRAAQIDFPDDDILTLIDVSRWRALDEQSVCASWIGRKPEALRIDRFLLTLDGVPTTDRERILHNRDQGALDLLEQCADYPADLVVRPASRRDAEVTVSLTTGPDCTLTERTLNSFLRCCTDSSRVGRFLIIETGLSAADRDALAASYSFLDFIEVPDADLNFVRSQIGGRYWLHLWHGWRFFTEDAIVVRLTDVLETERDVYQVGINFGDALQLSDDSPAREGVQVTPRGNRYVLSGTPTTGPAMFDMARLNRVLENSEDGALKGPTATLDEVLCVHAP